MFPEVTIIKELRKQFGMTQKDLAKAVNLEQSAISRFENGIIDPHYSKLRIIFNYFLKQDPYLFPDYARCLDFQNKLKMYKLFNEKMQSTLEDIITFEL